MSEQKLYKISFQNENGVIANIIACAPKTVSESKVLDSIAKEMASNYCEDNRYTYNDETVNDFKDGSSFRYLGIFKPDEEDYCDEESFTIISFNKTKRWSK